MSKWLWSNSTLKTPPEGSEGFIYKITCMDKTSEYYRWFYIGKKSFWSHSNSKVSKKRSLELWSGKGRKPVRERKIKESNWKKYNSSSKELQRLISELGEDKFLFSIICFGDSKSDLTLKEVEEMIEYNVLRTEKCWNMWINAKILKYNILKNL